MKLVVLVALLTAAVASGQEPTGKKIALLVAPFDKRTAEAKQAEWAKHLGKTGPVEENSLKMKLVLIPPGEFMMGSLEDEKDRSSDEKQHRVRITQPFCLAAHEVTKRQ